MARATSQRRHERDRRAPGRFTDDDREGLLDAYQHKCVACNQHEDLCGLLTADHVIPVSKGGSHDAFNRQPLCEACNKKKATSSIDYRPRSQANQSAA
jgi:5-methylcytosine-specific restriction endonuclease McrA